MNKYFGLHNLNPYLICPVQCLLDLVLDDAVFRVNAGNVVHSLGLAANTPAELNGLLREAIRRDLGLGINLYPEKICDWKVKGFGNCIPVIRICSMIDSPKSHQARQELPAVTDEEDVAQ